MHPSQNTGNQAASNKDESKLKPSNTGTTSLNINSSAFMQGSYNKNSTSNTQSNVNHTIAKDKPFSFQGQKLTNQLEYYERKNSRANKKKKKKGFKWAKPDSTKALLGFEEYVPSPFDQDNGYDINDVDIFHFKERPVRKKSHHKSSNFPTSQHVQANHRFVLIPNRNQNYFFPTYDPDYFVEWEDIFMVHAKRNTEYICPICREENMVAPQINKWGHIFCWPCILHYLLYWTESEGEGWRKCPLCEELVFKNSLKFAKVFIKPPPEENEVRTFRLAFRNKCSTVVKYYEESDTGKEERPKFENLEVFYSDSDAYSITRIRVWQEYDLIFDEFRDQLRENCKESENLGDTLRVSLCQEALDAIDEFEKEIKDELEYIYQQRATKENNTAEIDQSEKESQQANNEHKLNNQPHAQNVYGCLADTQK